MLDRLAARFSSSVDAYADFVVRRRGLVLVLAALVTIGGASGLPGLKTQTTFRIWHAPDAPEVVEYDAMLERFGSDDTALVAVRDPKGVLRNEALLEIDAMTQRFWRIEHVKRVESLTNFSLVKTTALEHESPALAVAGARVYAASRGGAIAWFDRETGAQGVLEGHEGLVEHLAAAPDGRRLYSAGQDRVARIWDLSSGTVIATVRGLPGSASALLVAPKGDRVYVGSLGAVLAFDPEGRRLFRAELGGGFVTHLALSADGGRLFAANETIRTLDAANGAQSSDWKVPNAPVTALVMAPSGDRVFVASEDGRVLAVDASSGTSAELLPRAPVAILSLAPSRDGAVLYAGAADGAIHTLSATGGPPPTSPSKLHEDWVVDLAVGPAGELYSASFDRTIGAITPGGAGAGARHAAHRAPVRRVLLAPARGELYSLGDDAAVYVWRLRGAAPELVARLSRTLDAETPRRPAIDGAETGSIELSNLFAHPVAVEVAGAPRGVVAPGAKLVIGGIPVGARTACKSEGECARGQSCDFEENVCVSPITVVATIPSVLGAPPDPAAVAWSGTIFARAGETVGARAPAEDNFAVQEVALSPLPEEASAKVLLERHPSEALRAALAAVLGQEALSDPATFLSARLASEVEARLSAEDASVAGAKKLLGVLAERSVAPNRLPMQPARLRETHRLLTRPPAPIALGYVLNPTADASLVFVSLHQPDHEHALERMVHLEAEMRSFLDGRTFAPGSAPVLSGEIIMDTSFKRYAESDMQKLGPVFAVLCALMLAALFRRPAGVLLPLGSIGLAVAFTMGVSAHLGATVNNMTGAVPQVVMACCLGDAVHLLTGWLVAVREGASPAEAARRSVRENTWPCLITMETTVVGFIALVPSEIAPIGTFGWMASIGAFAAFLATFTVMPAVLSFLPAGKLATAGTHAEESRTERWLGAWGTVVVARPTLVMAVSLAITVVGIYGVSDVVFDTNPITSFKRGTPFRDSSELIERIIAGPVGVEIMLDTGEARGLRKVKLLEAVAKVQAHIEASPGVTKVVGLPDIHRSLNRVFAGDRAEDYRIPATDKEVSAHYDAYTLSLPAGLELNNRVTEDESATRLTVRMRSISSSKVTAWQAEMLEWIRTNAPELKPTITGKFLVYSTMTNKLTQSFLWNVGSAVVMITLSMMLVLGSLRLGFVSMFPNVVPGIWAIGFISLLDVPLDVSIVVSLCVAIGVVVDDTIHFLVKFKSARAKQDVDTALVDTFRHAGLPLSFTTVVLCTGFAIFMASDYQVTSNFGLTTTIVFLVGVVLDFSLTPALVKLIDRGR